MQPFARPKFSPLHRLPYLAAFFVMILLLAACDDPPQKLVYQENFSNPKKFAKGWEIINGQWNAADNAASGASGDDWAVMLANRKLPQDYILTFSARMRPDSVLFEVLLGFTGEKYLGVYVYEIENKIAVEDRSLFLGDKQVQEGTFIRSTGNIGRLPNASYQFNHEWMVWKIQKTGSQLFVWINNRPAIGYNDTRGLLKPGGRFGFAIKGAGQIQNVQLYKTKDAASLPPAGFETRSEREAELPFLLFSE